MFIPTTLKIVIRKRSNQEGLYPIYLQFTQHRKVSKIALKKWLPLEAWEDANGNYIKRGFPNALELNMFLRTQINRAHEIILDYERKDKPISFNQFKDAFLDHQDTDFIKFCEMEIETRIQNGKHAADTIRSNKSKLNKLKKFRTNIAYHDLTADFLEKYENYLKNEMGNSHNTIFGAIKFIRTMINAARKKDLTDVYPFKNYTMSYKKDTRDRLYKEEVELLQKLYDSFTLSDSQQNVLKFFLFSCYTGLSWGDIESLKYSEISQRLNSYIIEKRRKKTDVAFVVPLIKKAKDMIDLDNEEGKVFPKIISNQKANLIIKEVVRRTKIKKHVSFHVARHSFATIALNNGIPREVVQKMLGHSSSRQTDLYSKVLNTYVIGQLDKMEGMKSKSSDYIGLELSERQKVIYKSIRVKVISLRVANDISELEMAQLLNITSAQYSDIEKGKRVMNLHELLVLEEKLGVECIKV